MSTSQFAVSPVLYAFYSLSVSFIVIVSDAVFVRAIPCDDAISTFAVSVSMLLSNPLYGLFSTEVSDSDVFGF